LSIVVMSQIKLIPTPSWFVYFVLKAQPFFINFTFYLCFYEAECSISSAIAAARMLFDFVQKQKVLSLNHSLN
jgi:hypothetical protein